MKIVLYERKKSFSHMLQLGFSCISLLFFKKLNISFGLHNINYCAVQTLTKMATIHKNVLAL